MSVEFEKKLAAILDFDNPARPTGLKKWVMVDPVWGHLKEHFCQVWCFYQILHTSVENLQLEPPLIKFILLELSLVLKLYSEATT